MGPVDMPLIKAQDALITTPLDRTFWRHLLRFIGNQTSIHTQKVYSAHVRQFLEFARSSLGMEGISDLARFTKDHAVIYLNYLQHSLRYKPSTIAAKLAALSRLFEELLFEGAVSQNPFARVKRPRVADVGTTPGLTREQVQKMLDQPDLSTRVGLRDYILLFLMFNLGLRVSETLPIRASDFYQDSGHTLVRIRRKGAQYIPSKVPPYLARLVRFYIARYPLPEPPRDFLFTSQARNRPHETPPRPIAPRNAWALFKKYARRAGLDWKNLSPHSARVFFINEVVTNSRGDVEMAQIAAGHKQISTTQRYRRRAQNLDDHAVDYVKLYVREVGAKA